MPAFELGDLALLQMSVGRSLDWLAKKPVDEVQHFGDRAVTVGQHRQALSDLATFLAGSPDAQTLSEYLAVRFVVAEASAQVLFTGYYEPELDAALVRQPGYDAPIFALPPDLVDIALGDFSEKYNGQHILARIEGNKVVPYYARADLPLTLPVLAWARDPVDVAFAEVQGSATLRLPDGTSKRIGFAGKNGRPYRGIGGLLIKEGHVRKEDMSMQAIRAWLADHPAERDRVLRYNESAVFFRFLDTEPIGALGVPVTPESSIATDLSVYPRGALALVSFPGFSRLVLNQDTGGAIKGPGRVDVFFGKGARAVEMAGHLKSAGALYFFIPR